MSKLSNPVEADGLIEKITRITNTTIAVYSNKARIANLNDALDQYWHLASESAPQFTFDDTGQSAIPIETQNLVDGTNGYKVSAFSNKVLNILRVSILNDDDSQERDLVYEDFEDVRDFLETYSTDSTDRGEPFHWTKIGDFIHISPTPDYNKTDGLRVYANRELTKFDWVTFTTTFANDKIDSTAHGLSNGDSVILETDNDDLPSGLTADTQVYYVINKTTDDFEVSTIIGGTKVSLADNGTGNHKYTEVSKIPGIPIIHHDYLARYASDQFMDTKHPKFQKNRADIALDIRDIQDYWQSAIRPGKTIIETNRRAYK